jgi:hypothetical protein
MFSSSHPTVFYGETEFVHEARLVQAAIAAVVTSIVLPFACLSNALA